MSDKPNFFRYYEKIFTTCSQISEKDNDVIAIVYNNLDLLICKIIDKNSAARHFMDEILINVFKNATDEEFDTIYRILEELNLTPNLFAYASNLVNGKMGGMKRNRGAIDGEDEEGEGEEEEEEEENVLDITRFRPVDVAIAMQDLVLYERILREAREERREERIAAQEERREVRRERREDQLRRDRWTAIVSTSRAVHEIGTPLGLAAAAAKILYDLGEKVCTAIIAALATIGDVALTGVFTGWNYAWSWIYTRQSENQVSHFFSDILQPLLDSGTTAVAFVAFVVFIMVFLICYLIISGRSIGVWNLFGGVQFGDANAIRNTETGEPYRQRQRLRIDNGNTETEIPSRQQLRIDNGENPQGQARNATRRYNAKPSGNKTLRLKRGGKKQKRKQTRNRRRSHKNKK